MPHDRATQRVPPLRRLWRHAAGHRRQVAFAATCSVLNRLFDLAPPLLIGVAVDTVVERQDSLLASYGIVDLRAQLYALAAVTALLWVLESLFEYLYQLGWRNLAQTVQHELRPDAYAHAQSLEQAYFEDRSTGGLLVAPQIAWFATAPIPLILWGSFRFQRLLEPRLAETFDLYQRAMASTRRILDLLEAEPAITDGPLPLRRPVRGALRFQGVRFAFAGGEEVLRGSTWTCPPARRRPSSEPPGRGSRRS